jgi:POT family proton-dependent oligopeptide transporter
MLVYIMSIPGGMIADRSRPKKGRSFRTIILCLGHGVLILTDTWAFTLVSNSGSGVVKPNISTMVGGLYPQVIFDAIKALVFSTLVLIQVHC